jgi:quercetin dioxygenase-like cupin family protein
MLRVIKVERWLPRQRDTGPASPDPGNPGENVIIRSASDLSGGTLLPPEGLPGEQAVVRPAGDAGCRRSDRDQRPDGSGPSPGARALRLHLVLRPPGTRGLPHRHDGRETGVYVVSGEAELWHGPGFAQRSTLRAGDYVCIPPGVPHLAVNQGDVTSIAVVTRTDPAGTGGRATNGTETGDTGDAGTVPVELPRHLIRLLGFPVGSE